VFEMGTKGGGTGRTQGKSANTSGESPQNNAIPAHAKSAVQHVVEICGISDEDAFLVLQECNMDIELAIDRHLKTSAVQEWAEVRRPSKKENKAPPLASNPHTNASSSNTSSARNYQNASSSRPSHDKRPYRKPNPKQPPFHSKNPGSTNPSASRSKPSAAYEEPTPEWAKEGVKPDGEADWTSVPAPAVIDPGVTESSVSAAETAAAVSKPKMNFAAALARGVQPKQSAPPPSAPQETPSVSAPEEPSVDQSEPISADAQENTESTDVAPSTDQFSADQSVASKPVNAWNVLSTPVGEQTQTATAAEPLIPSATAADAPINDMSLQFGSFNLGRDDLDWRQSTANSAASGAANGVKEEASVAAAAVAPTSSSAPISAAHAAPGAPMAVPSPAVSGAGNSVQSHTAAAATQGASMSHPQQYAPASSVPVRNAPSAAPVNPGMNMYNPIYSTPYGMMSVHGYPPPPGSYTAQGSSPQAYYDMSKYGQPAPGMMPDTGAQHSESVMNASAMGANAIGNGAPGNAGSAQAQRSSAGSGSDKNAAAAAAAAIESMNQTYMLPPGFSPAIAAQYASMYGYAPGPYGTLPPNHPYAQYPGAQASYSYAPYPGSSPAMPPSGGKYGSSAGAKNVSASSGMSSASASSSQHGMYMPTSGMDDGSSGAGGGKNLASAFGPESVGYQSGYAYSVMPGGTGGMPGGGAGTKGAPGNGNVSYGNPYGGGSNAPGGGWTGSNNVNNRQDGQMTNPQGYSQPPAGQQYYYY